MAAARELACTLQEAASFIGIVHEIAHEWSASYQRKGRPIDAAAGRAALCEFDGSPCPLFSTPRALLAGVGSKRPVQLAGLAQQPSSPTTARLASVVASDSANASATAGTPIAVLLLPVDTVPVTLVGITPQLVVVQSDEALPPSRWTAALESLAARLPAGFNGTTSRFLFPEPSPSSGAADGSTSAKYVRPRSRLVPPPLHRAAVLWRQPSACGSPPLWDLTRPIDEASTSEAMAAAAAVASGIPYSEWFACATIEVLRPLVRNLFRLPRRKGKSVWATCVRPASPCFWFTGEHMRGEHFVTQVLSSPDILLARLSAHRAAVLARLTATDTAAAATTTTSAAPPRWPPLFLVDPAAGEGNYTQHLPDGMGRMPALALVGRHGWHASLGEPDAPTFAWLRTHFGPYVAEGRVRLSADGVTHLPGATVAPLYSLEARVPLLENRYERGLPTITRQRLQWGSSSYRATALSVRGDLWLYNHLAGGPVAEALQLGGFAAAAAAFHSCKQNSGKLRRRCYNATVLATNITFVPWGQWLERHVPPGRKHGPIDLLVLDQRDPGVADLVQSFPLPTVKPSLLYYRTAAGSGTRRHLLANGYQTSAHFETSAWGENTLAWRADRCAAPGMPGKPAWADPTWLAAASKAMEAELGPTAPPRGRRRGKKRAVRTS